MGRRQFSCLRPIAFEGGSETLKIQHWTNLLGQPQARANHEEETDGFAMKTNSNPFSFRPCIAFYSFIPFRSRKTFLSITAVLVAAGSWCGCSTWPVAQMKAQQARYDFALIGDVPYTPNAETNTFPNMIAAINDRRLAFVVHDGDIKGGALPCHDEVLLRRYEQFQTFRHPFVLVFGDNEWTDCGTTNNQRSAAETYAPEERLQKLREVFTQGDRTMGRRTFSLCRQSQDPEHAVFRENVRWNYGQVMFATLNIPGSRNHFGSAEYETRNRANLTWLRQSFAKAVNEQCRAIMIIIQANPHFDLKNTDAERKGYNEFLELLEDETIAFQKPVVLVHGDSHYFRIDKPMMGRGSKRRVENFTRVETFGNPDVHWLRVSVDWRDPNVFTFRQEIVEKNLVRHRP